VENNYRVKRCVSFNVTDNSDLHHFAHGSSAKYCDEHIVVFVCLSVCRRGYLCNQTCNLTNYSVRVACRCGLVLLRQGVTKYQGERAVLGVFFPIDSALYSIAFVTHTKTDEPIDMPFGMMTLVACRYHLLDR